MLGAPGVGKSSLVRQYVHSVFSEEYKSTLGVKVDRKIVMVDGWSVTLLLWDMHGETEGLDVPVTYLSGTAAAMVVFDSTRPETIITAETLRNKLKEQSPAAPVHILANKSDLDVDWPTVNEASRRTLGMAGYPVSAKTGDGVDDVFTSIAARLVPSD